MILTCTCKHTIQDQIHGKGRRVFNKTRKGVPGSEVFRCTVCGEIKTKKGK